MTGPKNVLSGVTSLKTKLIYLSGLDKSVKRQVPLDLPADIQKFVGEIMVAVEIVVEDEMRRQVVEHVPVLLGPNMRGYLVQPAEVSIIADYSRSIWLGTRLQGTRARFFQGSLWPDEILKTAAYPGGAGLCSPETRTCGSTRGEGASQAGAGHSFLDLAPPVSGASCNPEILPVPE